MQAVQSIQSVQAGSGEHGGRQLKYHGSTRKSLSVSRAVWRHTTGSILVTTTGESVLTVVPALSPFILSRHLMNNPLASAMPIWVPPSGHVIPVSPQQLHYEVRVLEGCCPFSTTVNPPFARAWIFLTMHLLSCNVIPGNDKFWKYNDKQDTLLLVFEVSDFGLLYCEPA